MRIFDQPRASGGATHAFVVGVGAYPHLPPAMAAERDLSTAAVSAVGFADWLVNEYQNADAPLATVELVLTPGTFEGRWCDGSVETATLANIRKAFLAWFAEADASPNNVAIFYFAGHGLWYDKPHLLTEDFDPTDPAEPWGGSFSMEATHNGMGRCRAAYQVFFIEACQTLPQDLANAPGIDSRGLLNRSIAPSSREAPIIYASKPHHPAHGRAGEVANFTSALLEFLRGAGAEEKEDGVWEIATSDLMNVREIMSYRARMENGPEQEPHGELSGGRRFASFPSPPNVQAHITANPDDLIAQHQLELQDINHTLLKTMDPRPDRSPWRVEIPKGYYQFRAGPVPRSQRVTPILSSRPIVVLS